MGTGSGYAYVDLKPENVMLGRCASDGGDDAASCVCLFLLKCGVWKKKNARARGNVSLVSSSAGLEGELEARLVDFGALRGVRNVFSSVRFLSQRTLFRGSSVLISHFNTDHFFDSGIAVRFVSAMTGGPLDGVFV